MCVYCLKCTKFGKLFVRKVIKTVATRYLDYSSKHPKMRLAAGLRPDPLGERLSSPRPPSRKRGPTSKGREGRGWEGGKGKGGEGFCRTNQNMAATALTVELFTCQLPSAIPYTTSY